jgi:hypothetical protein
MFPSPLRCLPPSLGTTDIQYNDSCIFPYYVILPQIVSYIYLIHGSRDSSVGIATRLDYRASIPRRVKRFFSSVTFRLALGPIQPHVQWVLGAVSLRVESQGMKLTTHFDLLPMSRMVELYIHSPKWLPGIMLNDAIKYRDSFTLPYLTSTFHSIWPELTDIIYVF